MKYLLIVLVLIGSGEVQAQSGTFQDPRDGNIYRTLIINGKKWFREHLRLRTSNSYFKNTDKDTSGLANGNYYSNNELEGLCPAGWHLPTIAELEEYIQYMAFRNGIPDSAIKRTISKDIDSSLMIKLGNCNPLQDTLLQLYSIGWVEGRKLKIEKSLSLWIRDTKNQDLKFHTHIGLLGYIIHTHEHNIIDKPKRVRRFPVRCVCDEAF
jgi:uncharacterized protein (TIGR02145 family)